MVHSNLKTVKFPLTILCKRVLLFRVYKINQNNQVKKMVRKKQIEKFNWEIVIGSQNK